jgi:hypothetical protein
LLFHFTFEWLTSHAGCHTTTDPKPEVQLSFNDTCVHVVERIVCGICTKQRRHWENKEDINTVWTIWLLERLFDH